VENPNAEVGDEATSQAGKNGKISSEIKINPHYALPQYWLKRLTHILAIESLFVKHNAGLIKMYSLSCKNIVRNLPSSFGEQNGRYKVRHPSPRPKTPTTIYSRILPRPLLAD
jgi:hypothetical protein